MKRSQRFWISAVMLIGLGPACAVYNESCPVTRPEVWGTINTDFDIRRIFVRQCEAPVGNFLADALFYHAYNQPGVTVNLALFNGGAIRDEVVCGGASGTTRERIPKGPITDQDVYQMMPFHEDTVVLVKLSGEQLLRVLENAVSLLPKFGENAGDQADQMGRFLHVSGGYDNALGQSKLKVRIDCEQQAQELSEDGKSIRTQGQRVSVTFGGGFPLEPTATYWLATLDYLTGQNKSGQPNDGYVAFHEAGVEVINTNIPVIEIVHEWIAGYGQYRTTNGNPPAPDPNYPSVEGRLERISCSDVCK